MKTLGLYLHIPFCLSKCRYCDFYSLPESGKAIPDRYIDTLCRHMEDYALQAKDYIVTTVYFGGGTPSLLTPEQMKKLIEQLRDDFDYILIDCPAGIERGFYNAIAGADRALIVTTPEVSAIRDADRITGLLEASHIKNINLIINRIRFDMVRRGDMMSIEDIVDILSLDLIGVIPDDENVVVAANQGESLTGYHTPAGKAYENICRRIMGEDVPLACYPRRKSFFFRVADYLIHR